MRPLSCTFILITISFKTPIIMKMIITYISNSTYFKHVNTFFTNYIKAVTYTLFFSLLIHFTYSRIVLSRCVQINHTQICQEFNVWIICIYSPAGRGLIDACSNCVTSTPPVSEWCIVNEITWVFTRIKRFSLLRTNSWFLRFKFTSFLSFCWSICWEILVNELLSLIVLILLVY